MENQIKRNPSHLGPLGPLKQLYLQRCLPSSLLQAPSSGGYLPSLQGEGAANLSSLQGEGGGCFSSLRGEGGNL